MQKVESISQTQAPTGGLRAKVQGFFNNSLKTFENIGARNGAAARLYYRLFYRRMITSEIALSGIQPGARVIHVGSGPLPLTAVGLAESGFTVEAVDRDPDAAMKASRFIDQSAYPDRASVRPADGLDVDFSNADAIWFSFTVFPREKLLRKAFSSLKEGGRLVYRNPRGWLSLVYPKIDPAGIAPFCPAEKVRQTLGKETYVITKAPLLRATAFEGASSCTGIPLGALKKGQAAVIASIPEGSVLPCLGFRPGKTVHIHGNSCFGGPLLAEIEDRLVALGRRMAQDVRVVLPEAEEGRLGETA